MSRVLKSLSSKVGILIERKLWLQVLVGLVLGIQVGLLLGPDLGLFSPEMSTIITNWLALPGLIFLQLATMIIIPLIFSSIITGIAGKNGDIEFLKKIGPKVFLYFVFTTIIAIIIGLSLSFLIQPGNYIDSSQLNIATNEIAPEMTASFDSGRMFEELPKMIANVLPSNPFTSIVEGDMLGVVVVTIIFAIAILTLTQESRDRAIKILETVQQITMTIVKWVMHLAPFAVFGLIAQITAQIGLKTLIGLGMYVLTVILGLLILIGFYYVLILLFSNTTPRIFFMSTREPMLLAFSTSSSAAAMPISLQAAENELHVKPALARFLIPVGATINMNGTALYQAVATVFLAQVFNVPLSITGLLLIIVLTVGASIGSPSTPGVGIIILATILESVGIPAAGIALILGVDRILDMCRTAVNVTGDLSAATIFDKQIGNDPSFATPRNTTVSTSS